jgi:hypothetical protein
VAGSLLIDISVGITGCDPAQRRRWASVGAENVLSIVTRGVGVGVAQLVNRGRCETL